MDALILDLDGTLYSYPPCHDAGLSGFAGTWECEGLGTRADGRESYLRGQEMTHLRLRGQGACHHRLLYAQFAVEQKLGRSSLALSLQLEQSYWAAFFSTMTLRPGARRFLETLRERSISTVLLTDLVTSVQMRKLQALGLEDLFDYLVTSEEVGEEKPSPKMFHAALEKLGMSPNSGIWMVGDSWEKDIVPAHDLGMSTAWLQGRPDSKLEMGSVGASSAGQSSAHSLILKDFSTAFADMVAARRS